jgi:hypothetical protein
MSNTTSYVHYKSSHPDILALVAAKEQHLYNKQMEFRDRNEFVSWGEVEMASILFVWQISTTSGAPEIAKECVLYGVRLHLDFVDSKKPCSYVI